MSQYFRVCACGRLQVRKTFDLSTNFLHSVRSPHSFKLREHIKNSLQFQHQKHFASIPAPTEDMSK